MGAPPGPEPIMMQSYLFFFGIVKKRGIILIQGLHDVNLSDIFSTLKLSNTTEEQIQ